MTFSRQHSDEARDKAQRTKQEPKERSLEVNSRMSRESEHRLEALTLIGECGLLK